MTMKPATPSERVEALRAAHLMGAADCGNDECMICSVLDCPYASPAHYDKDGCNSCYIAANPDPRQMALPLEAAVTQATESK